MSLPHERLTLAALLVVTVVASAQSTTADRVYGQGDSFTSNAPNNGGISATSLNDPRATAVDLTGGLYIVDGQNDRVLHFPANSTTADRVYGQGGSFTSGAWNNGGISAMSLGSPSGVAVDASGGLYVADFENNRVLHFPTNSTNADRVYGQGGSFTSNTINKGGVSAGSMWFPVSVAVDLSGGIYVADSQNNRILHFPADSTTADRVYGQGGSYTSNIPSNGGVNAASLGQTEGVAVDAGGGLYVADFYDCRVLHFPANSTTADRVYGQGGSFTSNAINKGGVSAGSLWFPVGVTVDASGGLYVADDLNNRALHFSANNITADRVWGQAGSFTSNTGEIDGVSARSLYFAVGVDVDANGGLYVIDGNNRVLHFPGNVSATPISNTGLLMLVGLAALGGLLAVRRPKGTQTTTFIR